MNKKEYQLQVQIVITANGVQTCPQMKKWGGRYFGMNKRTIDKILTSHFQFV